MIFIRNFLPLLIFLGLYIGSSLYFFALGNSDAFYKFSPLKAIIPALLIGIFLGKRSAKENLKSVIQGIKNTDILMMCGIFLLAGAFCPLTSAIGSVDTLVQVTLKYIPHSFLLIGVFFISALISTAIGTSMGVVALIVPIVLQLAEQGGFSLGIGVATVISGAMFGDNLSLVSDTTIASVLSQGADFKKKFQLNAVIALLSGAAMVAFLYAFPSHSVPLPLTSPNLINILPYGVLLGCALIGFNVFKVLSAGILSACIIGFFHYHLPLSFLGEQMLKGALSMQEITCLSLLIGGMGKLLQDQGAMAQLLSQMTSFIEKGHQKKRAEGVISFIVSIMDILLANNTIAIVLSGEFAKNLANRYHIPPHRSALLLDNFSCVFQGILPYGAQILLASKLSGVLALTLASQVYYCFILGVFTIVYILFFNNSKNTDFLK
jgi:Na+/H+ antiporter NhaC